MNNWNHRKQEKTSWQKGWEKVKTYNLIYRESRIEKNKKKKVKI